MDKYITKLYKTIIACIELFFGIPFLGSTFIIDSLWIPLGVLLALHMVGLVFENSKNVEKTGHVIGVIGNVLGVIPLIGMIFHIVTGVMLLIEVIYEK